MPPLTAVPIDIGKEPWRERPRLRAMNQADAPFRGRSRHGSRCSVRRENVANFSRNDERVAGAEVSSLDVARRRR